MKDVVKQLNALSLPATILLAAVIAGGFYYATQISKQNSIERQQQIKIEQAEKERREQEEKIAAEKAEAEKKKAEAEWALNKCILDAEEEYSRQWRAECKSQGKLSTRCIEINDMTYEEYAREKGIPEDENGDRFDTDTFAEYFDEKENCSCRLPLANADRIEASRESDKNACYKRHLP